MGLSSSKKTTKETSNQAINPVAPQYIQDYGKDYMGMVTDLMGKDPQSFVAGTAPLQQQAFDMASSMGNPTANFDTAMNTAQGALSAPVSKVAGSMFDAPKVAAASQINPNKFLSEIQTANTYDPAALGDPALAESARIKDFMGDYQNPYMQQVVDTSLAGYDMDAGRALAGMEANAARNKAFGGSRYAIESAMTNSELARGRANLEATLRAQGFDSAAALGAQDAGFRNQANLFNTGQINDFSQTRGEWENEASQFGADAQNEFAMGRANIGADVASANAQAQNQRAAQQAQLQAQAASQNAQLQQQAAQFNTQQEAEAAQRQLQVAQLQAQIAAQGGQMTQQQIALLAELGGIQQNTAATQLTAPISLAQAVGTLGQLTPYDALVGKNIAGNSTTVEKSKPSLFGQILAAASAASSFIPGG